MHRETRGSFCVRGCACAPVCFDVTRLVRNSNVEIDVQFKAVVCGDRHTLAIASFVEGANDSNCRLYSWGDGGGGRLGQGSDEDCWYPTLVEHWMGSTAVGQRKVLVRGQRPYPVDVASISAGLAHSAAVTLDVCVWVGRVVVGVCGCGCVTGHADGPIWCAGNGGCGSCA